MLSRAFRNGATSSAAAAAAACSSPPSLFVRSPSWMDTPTPLATSASVACLLHPTRTLRRPQTVKPNPFTTESGKFDQSFEKMVGSLEQRLPFRQHHLKKGYIYDRNFGEENMDQMKEAAKQDLEGREPESQAARQARSYFTGDDLSPEALHVRSPKLKVAQQIQRQRYDKKILKTTAEPAEYYYKEYSLREKQQRTFVYWLCVAAGGVVIYLLWRRLAAYMRTDYDSFTIDADGNARKLIRH